MSVKNVVLVFINAFLFSYVVCPVMYSIYAAYRCSGMVTQSSCASQSTSSSHDRQPVSEASSHKSLDVLNDHSSPLAQECVASTESVCLVKKFVFDWDKDFMKNALHHVPKHQLLNVMRILKNDGVDRWGHYTVSILMDTIKNDLVSFQWKHKNGTSRVYYAYSPIGMKNRFFASNGVSANTQKMFSMPLSKAVISSPFGMRYHPVHGRYKHHKGTDFAAPIGTCVYAAGPGVIIHKGPLSGFGKCIHIQHKNGYVTTYAHLDRYASGVHNQKKVDAGQIIGFVGKTGATTGPHLHYEVKHKGKSVNPILFTEKTKYLSKKERRALDAKISYLNPYYQNQ